jgi:hypothetical protein
MSDDEILICGVPEEKLAYAEAAVCQWPRGAGGTTQITWSIADPIPGMTFEAQKAAASVAFSALAEVCGIRHEYTDNARTAMIVMTAGRIDGPSGTLAWSELPCGSPKQLGQKYDTSEQWVIAFDQVPQRGIDITRVFAHELGHALGLSHGPSGNLLAPAYSPRVSRPQAWDIEQLQARYGPPVRPVPPPPPDPTPNPNPSPDPNGGSLLKNVLDILESLMPMLRLIAGQTKTRVDDLVLELLGELLKAADAGDEQAQAAALESIKSKLSA